MNEQIKAAVTVAEMSRMIGMSRSRFYQLIGEAFPEPSRDDKGRPYFNEDQQRTIIEVPRSNCGIDGKPILFYAPRNSISKPVSKRRSQTRNSTQHAEIISGVQALGLTVSSAQVDSEIKKTFPNGINGLAIGEVIRSVFLSIKRKN